MNCWVRIHYLEVSYKEDQITRAARSWFIFVQLSNKQWIISQQFTPRAYLFLNKSIRALFHRKASLHFINVSSHYVFHFSCLPIHLSNYSHAFNFSCLPVHLSNCSHVCPFNCLSVPMYSISPVYLSTCLPVPMYSSLPVYLYNCSHVFQSSCPPIYMCPCLPVHLSTHLLVCLSTCLSVYMCPCLPAHLSTHPLVYLFLCIPFFLSTCPPVYALVICLRLHKFWEKWVWNFRILIFVTSFIRDLWIITEG